MNREPRFPSLAPGTPIPAMPPHRVRHDRESSFASGLAHGPIAFNFPVWRRGRQRAAPFHNMLTQDPAEQPHATPCPCTVTMHTHPGAQVEH